MRLVEHLAYLFHVLKCKVIHYGRGNPEYSYYMNDRELEAVTEEKDLGVLFQKDLKFSSHISQKINKADRMLAIIKELLNIWIRRYS